MSLTLETKTTVPVPYVPPGTGLKTQNGYQVVVEQVGDSQTPGVADDERAVRSHFRQKTAGWFI
ncbi:MAG: hypothetical protein R3F37_23215 [Candidatus Competibacteraceae bacterium]